MANAVKNMDFTTKDTQFVESEVYIHQMLEKDTDLAAEYEKIKGFKLSAQKARFSD